MSQIRYCLDTNCDLAPHAENCPECFGFGKYDDGRIVSAGDVENLAFSHICPECGGQVINGENIVHNEIANIIPYEDVFRWG